MKRICSYCGQEVTIKHKHRLLSKHVFCDKGCEAFFRKKEPNTRCWVCGKPMTIKNYRLNRVKSKQICCSKKCSSVKKSEMYLGKSNPNSKYEYNFKDIYNLTDDGAYILGLIFSDGHIKENTISIYQNKISSGHLLNKISERLTGSFDNVKVSISNTKLNILTLNSKELVDFVLKLGGINKGKKSCTIELPNIPSDKVWSFVCGYFDGDGSFKYNYKYPEISITSNSENMLRDIAGIWEVNYTGKDKISASGNKALDICGKMYENVSFRHTKKYEYFMDILNWEPFPNNGWYRDLYFKCKKLSPEAIVPTKSRVTDSGYDIYAVNITYDDKTGLYVADTRLAVEPIQGWYFDMVGRSSLPKTGFMFVGCVGIIDRSYVGPIKMLLKKIRDDAEIPESPFKMAQLIPRKIIHAEFLEVDSLGDSGRGENGFGSTGR